MTTVHVVPSGEPPQNHTLGDCQCRPLRRPRRREDGTVIDEIHVHRSAQDDEPRSDHRTRTLLATP